MGFKLEIGCRVVELSLLSKNHKKNKQNQQTLVEKNIEAAELGLGCCRKMKRTRVYM